MQGENLKKFERDNVEIKHFPFIQYRTYMPVLYSHMLISSFLTAARLNVFHSPEGLIPFIYPGNIISNFHYIPQGKSESSIFSRTYMFGAKMAFSQLCKRAQAIVVHKPSDKKLLSMLHGYPKERIEVLEAEDLQQVDWAAHIKKLHKLYRKVGLKK